MVKKQEGKKSAGWTRFRKTVLLEDLWGNCSPNLFMAEHQVEMSQKTVQKQVPWGDTKVLKCRRTCCIVGLGFSVLVLHDADTLTLQNLRKSKPLFSSCSYNFMKRIDGVGSIPGVHWDVPNNCQLWLRRDGCSPRWLSFGLLRLNKSPSLYFWFRTRYNQVISALGLTPIPLRLHLHLSRTPLPAPGTSLLAPLQAFCSSSSQDNESLASAPWQFLIAAFPSQLIVFWYRSADFGANPGTREQEPCSSARWLPGGALQVTPSKPRSFHVHRPANPHPSLPVCCDIYTRILRIS